MLEGALEVLVPGLIGLDPGLGQVESYAAVDALRRAMTAGQVAGRLRVLFDEPALAHVLVVAATLHDIGYSAQVRRSGFHPLDGADFLRGEGYPELLCRLVGNHSLAVTHAGEHRGDLTGRYAAVEGLLADALAYADMHSSPDGRTIRAEPRLADIAARHPDRQHAARAVALRQALARVGTALLTAAPLPPRYPHLVVVDGVRVFETADHRRVDVCYCRWTAAEAAYAAELAPVEPNSAPPDHAWAVRLAQLRVRADRCRDDYLRRMLAGYGPGAANIVGLTDQTDLNTTIRRALGLKATTSRP